MGALGSAEGERISRAARQIVAGWLRANGYTIQCDESAGPKCIEAVNRKVRLLVLVRSAMLPKTPRELPYTDKQEIVSRAAREGFQAWDAEAVLDGGLRLAGSIG
ncbi:MAG: hypothetical protein PHU85_11600 [Phycisphaerae bacterium]|nr:hypothetical protein [Phycisphaerae bacterium]